MDHKREDRPPPLARVMEVGRNHQGREEEEIGGGHHKNNIAMLMGSSSRWGSFLDVVDSICAPEQQHTDEIRNFQVESKSKYYPSDSFSIELLCG